MNKEKNKIFVLLHNIRSLQNIGSVFRTSEVFGLDCVFLTGYTGKPPNPKISKTALGAEDLVLWKYNLSPIRLIKGLKKDYPNLLVLGLENNLPKRFSERTMYVNKLSLPKTDILLVLGEEVGGIQKNLLAVCDLFLEIPQSGKKESLNVSVAFGVAAFCLSSGQL